ncbi:MAG: hypothetical protein GKS05_01680 [Nitrospirales bacterium]|nr:hypothetical protein [Nitrospirales bacterium]
MWKRRLNLLYGIRTPLNAVWAITLGGLLMISSPVLAYEEKKDFQGGTLMGVVSLKTSLPTPRRHNLVVYPDPYFCGRVSDGHGWRLSPFLQPGTDHTLPGIVVYIKDIKKGKPTDAQTPIIKTQDCRFSPYISVVGRNKVITFQNWDPVIHRVEVFQPSIEGARLLIHEDLQRNPNSQKSDFLTMGKQGNHVPGSKIIYTVQTSGPLIFRCSYHDYMEGWSLILEHPYFFITRKDGTFSITDIPSGTYTLIAWHPSGTAEKVIQVQSAQTLNITLDFRPTPVKTDLQTESKANPFGIDLIGDSRIVPTVERQQWNE